MSTDSDRRRRFEAVADDVYEPLQRYLRRRASAADAADVFGDTLLTVWRRLEDVPIDAALPWCYGVARRCLANHRRGDARRDRLTERVVAHLVTGADSDPQRHVDALDPDLHRAIETLTESEQEIVHLWAWEQLEPREIALALDQTPNAVSVALSRVKRKLASELAHTDPSTPAGADPALAETIAASADCAAHDPRPDTSATADGFAVDEPVADDDGRQDHAAAGPAAEPATAETSTASADRAAPDSRPAISATADGLPVDEAAADDDGRQDHAPTGQEPGDGTTRTGKEAR